MNKSEFITGFNNGSILPNSDITITAKTMAKLLVDQSTKTYISVHNILADVCIHKENGVTDYNKQQFIQSDIETPVLVDALELKALFNEIERLRNNLSVAKETIATNTKLVNVLVDKSLYNKPPRVDIYG